MGREARRVPLDFDWPLNETWEGYLMPERLREQRCGHCDARGYSPVGKRLLDQWYGNASFTPAETGSQPLTDRDPDVWTFAARNVERAPEFYGTGDVAILREARRLADLWNGAWSHHLVQDDVDALVAAGRLRDFTHTWTKEDGWKPIDPPPAVTAAEVNRWSLAGFGHDSINAHIAVEAKCARLGETHLCATCKGFGSVERYEGQRAEAEAWVPTDPPEGDGWQMWETTSEGSPASPVFATAEELADWCVNGATVFGNTRASRDEWLRIITGEDFAHVTIAPGVVVM